MPCDSCKSDRVFKVGGKSSDCNNWTYRGREGNGYLPIVMNICGGDYYDFAACLNCGKLQGKFPVENEELENDPAAKAQEFFMDNFGNRKGRFFALGLVNPVEMVDVQGRTFCENLQRWEREVYGFLISPTDGELNYLYIFIDPEWNMEMVERRHYALPSSRKYEMTEISAG